MDAHRPLTDCTLPLLAEGYAWLPDRMRESTGHVVRTRLLGKPALAVRGPAAVRLLYDETHVHRHGALPRLCWTPCSGRAPSTLHRVPTRPRSGFAVTGVRVS